MQRMVEITFSVNNESKTLKAYPMERLLDVLREQLRLTGTKEGCGEGECGACSVIIDGRIVNSCLVPVAQVAGCEIKTIEGIPLNANQLHAVQQAFIECGGAQCGICTPYSDRDFRPGRSEYPPAWDSNLFRVDSPPRL